MHNADLWIIKSDRGWLDSKSTYIKVLNNYVPCVISDLEYNEYGKPFLKGNPQVFFSVSHNSNIMVIAATTECALGVDIELKRRKNIDPNLIANKFFHELEVNELNKTNDLLGSFMQMWVIKEAFVKMKGSGILYGLNKFYVDIVQSKILDGKSLYTYNLIDIEPSVICAIVPQFEYIKVYQMQGD